MSGIRRHSSLGHNGLQHGSALTVMLLVAVMTLAGGLTFALWSAALALPHSGTVHAGDLQVTTGDATWLQVTPGVTDPASGTLVTTPAGFASMPGDVVEIRVPVTTYLRGDNLTADLTVEVGPATGDVTVTVWVTDAQGRLVAGPAQVLAGERLVVEGLVGNDAGVSTQWTVVLRAEVTGDYRWVTPGDAPATVTWNVGTVDVSLDQTRGGTR